MAVFEGVEDDLQLKSSQVDYTRHLVRRLHVDTFPWENFSPHPLKSFTLYA